MLFNTIRILNSDLITPLYFVHGPKYFSIAKLIQEVVGLRDRVLAPNVGVIQGLVVNTLWCMGILPFSLNKPNCFVASCLLDQDILAYRVVRYTDVVCVDLARPTTDDDEGAGVTMHKQKRRTQR